VAIVAVFIIISAETGNYHANIYFFCFLTKKEQGKIIAEIDKTQARNMLSAAESQTRQTNGALARMKQLNDNGSLAEIKRSKAAMFSGRIQISQEKRHYS